MTETTAKKNKFAPSEKGTSERCVHNGQYYGYNLSRLANDVAPTLSQSQLEKAINLGKPKTNHERDIR